jgi:putative ATP-binding cassette transporter
MQLASLRGGSSAERAPNMYRAGGGFAAALAGRPVGSRGGCLAAQHAGGSRRENPGPWIERMDTGKELPLSHTAGAPRAFLKSDSVVGQLRTLLRALAGSRYRNHLALLALAVVVVICANTAGQIWLNRWQGAFYEAIEQRNVPEFLTQLMVFAVIAGALLVLVVSQTWLRAMIDVRLREWLTHDLLDQWLVSKRIYLLGFAGEIGVNPDQRIQQDAQHLTDLTTTLAIGLLQSTLLLGSFTGVLWLLSEQVVFDFGHGRVTIPGYMVWCALAYSLGGSLLAWHIGRPLVPLNAERYAREADLRIALVRINERADGIVLHGGEADERRLLDQPVDNVISMMTRLAGALARLTWITSGYGWLAIVVPFVVAAPGYFDGDLSFGTIMVVVGAFNQVQSSLRWFVDNLPQIADWRATLLRVVAFRDALATVDTIGAGTGRIEVVDSPSDKLEFDDLQLALPETCATLDPSRVEMSPGERIQILGDAASGKSTLFRALAGMWPWGGGTLRLPPREAMMFMPQRPYLPLGTLRAAVCYPAEPGRFDKPPWSPRSSGWTSATLCPRLTAPTAGIDSCRSTSSSVWRLRACCCTRRVGSCSMMRSARLATRIVATCSRSAIVSWSGWR